MSKDPNPPRSVGEAAGGESAREEPDAAGHPLVRTVHVLALEGTLAEIVRSMAARGVSPLLLKGAGTARWLYDTVDERPYGDLDLLVAPDEHTLALEVLREIGFEPLWSVPVSDVVIHHHDNLIRHRSISVSVELHRTLYWLSAPEPLVWKRLNENAEPIEVAGVRVRVPAPAAAALIVALHAAQHGAGAVRPMADLARAAARADAGVWRAAAALARDLDVTEAFAAGLCLSAAGRHVAADLGLLDVPESRLVRLRGLTPPQTAMGVERLVTAQGTAARLRLLSRELFPSPEFMRMWQPVARRGRRGLAATYLWRPFWLGAKLPRGAWAWLRAARPSRGGRAC